VSHQGHAFLCFFPSGGRNLALEGDVASFALPVSYFLKSLLGKNVAPFASGQADSLRSPTVFAFLVCESLFRRERLERTRLFCCLWRCTVSAEVGVR
jgi:hypothetical protein